MANFLHGTPEKPPPVTEQNNLSEKETIAMRARKGKGAIKNTLKAVVSDGERRLNDDGQTQLDESMDKEDDVESEDLACHDEGNVPMSEQGSELPMDLNMTEQEGLAML
ncbi:hypothetical protein F442_14145 [Phytophthora nicotianae P10297]|uniref:Uncharacterized protein n=1 Tax=Phytophthora nicotianae P10297 TaxID=1317064 RepID=W2YTK1_PHYNI|nr:hypothetical protein F442_14145 [Phytophthora nicotianae P10297]